MDNIIDGETLLNNVYKNIIKDVIVNITGDTSLMKDTHLLEDRNEWIKKYTENVKLIAGDTNKVLKELDLNNIDFTFLDGGHSYQTVINDLSILYENMKGKNKVVLCDDYGEASFIQEVKNAIDDFSNKNNIKVKIIENRFAELTF